MTERYSIKNYVSGSYLGCKYFLLYKSMNYLIFLRPIMSIKRHWRGNFKLQVSYLNGVKGMNRIFKVVFSKVLGRHVVVSEVASAIQRGACKAVMVAAIVLSGLGFSSSAMALDYGRSFDAAIILTSVEGDIGMGVLRADKNKSSDNAVRVRSEADYNNVLLPLLRDTYGLSQQDAENLVATVKKQNPDYDYYFDLIKTQATGQFTSVLDTKVVQTMGQNLHAGQNVGIQPGSEYLQADITITNAENKKEVVKGVYLDVDGKPLLKENGNPQVAADYITEKADIPNIEGTTKKNALPTTYTINAADSKIISLEPTSTVNLPILGTT
ncbi:MAG: ESPR domain-containing protein [Oxalobacter sp.]|nr:ESPR domain-containing protein [Oxalobacter sp.]